MAAQDINPQLDIIYRMMSAFSSNADVDEALQQGLQYVQKSLNAEAASFFILDEEKQTVTCRACFGPVDITGLEIPQDQGIVGSVIAAGDTRFIADCVADPDFNSAVDEKTGFTTRSMICAPVAGLDKKFGALQLINKLDANPLFKTEDAALVTVLANSAALALSNSEMTKAIVESEKTKRDLRMAARIQENLFPQTSHAVAHGHNIPMKGVSGDLYDFVERDGRLYFCLGDVAGKGINAALVMAKTHSLFRSLSRSRPDIDQLTADINRELVETATNGMFVTAIIGFYDLSTNRVDLCNAGHEPGLVLSHNGEAHYIDASLHPLGIMEFAPEAVQVETLDLTTARFFTYSDGLTEAKFGEEMLGADKLAEQLKSHSSVPLSQQVDAVVKEVHQASDIISDDLTLLGIGY
ncbi:MAG: PP2C family protein-serine/threonine phosphatase [Parvibaculales bacterium]